MAASTVHWLMLDETMFMRAMGAWRTVRGPLEGRDLLGELREEGRHPLDEHELADAGGQGQRLEAVHEGMDHQVEHQAAADEEPDDGGAAHPRPQAQHLARNVVELRGLLVVLGGHPVQDEEVGQVDER